MLKKGGLVERLRGMKKGVLSAGHPYHPFQGKYPPGGLKIQFKISNSRIWRLTVHKPLCWALRSGPGILILVDAA